MRIPLALTNVKTRTGAPNKDARIKNAYVEIKGDQGTVRKRPASRGGLPVGTGTAQGGIGINYGGVSSVVVTNGDVVNTYTLAQLGLIAPNAWNASTNYSLGSFVDIVTVPSTDPFVTPPVPTRYFALAPNTNKYPISNPNLWSTAAIPSTRFYATGQGYDGPPGYTTPSCATALAATQTLMNMLTKISCTGDYPPQTLWMIPSMGVAVIGDIGYGYGTGTSSLYPTCPGAPPAFLAFATIVQTA